MKKKFKAPWSNKLKLLTTAFVVIIIIITFVTKTTGSTVAIIILLICAALAVRGYSIRNGQLLILRMGWSTKYDLAKLKSAEFSPNATMGSIRTFGIGGLGGFIGYFRNSILGSYRAFATDKKNTVVLDFAGRKIVVTPENPEEFVQAIRQER
jgi:hypothetical protein